MPKKKKEKKITMQSDVKNLNGKQIVGVTFIILLILGVLALAIYLIVDNDNKNIEKEKEKQQQQRLTEEWKTVGLIELTKEELEDKDVDYYEYCVSNTKDYKNSLWTKVEDGKIAVNESGHKYVYVRSVDKDGNDSAVVLHELFVDTDKPVIEEVQELDEEQLTVRIKASDDTSSIKRYFFSIDNQNYEEITMTHTFKNLDKKEAYILYIVVEDQAGNSTKKAFKIGNKDIKLEVPNIEE